MAPKSAKKGTIDDAIAAAVVRPLKKGTTIKPPPKPNIPANTPTKMPINTKLKNITNIFNTQN